MTMSLEHRDQRRFGLSLRVAVIAATLTALALPAAAGASKPKYLACDNPHSPNYPTVRQSPTNCDLGLGASFYDSQPVPGHDTPDTIGMTRLRWRHWGRNVATAHGRSCLVNPDDGRVSDPAYCGRVTVTVSKPQAIGPAGFAVIYQLIRVDHAPTAVSDSYTDYYQPGVDY